MRHLRSIADPISTAQSRGFAPTGRVGTPAGVGQPWGPDEGQRSHSLAAIRGAGAVPRRERATGRHRISPNPRMRGPVITVRADGRAGGR